MPARKGAPRPDLRPRWCSPWYGVRQRLGLSRPALSTLIGYSTEAIKKWETRHGNPPPWRAQLLYQLVADNSITSRNATRRKT